MLRQAPFAGTRIALTLMALVGLLAFLGTGCGYRLVGAANAPNLTISVVTLDNDSLEPGVELTVSRALRQEFLRSEAPRLISSPDAADLVLRGRVLPLEVRANSFDTVAFALEYRIEMALELTLSSVDADPIELDRNTLTQAEFYLASADPEATRKNREEALRRIADVLASRVHDEIGLQLVDRPLPADPGGAAREAPQRRAS